MNYELDHLILEALSNPEIGRSFFNGTRREMYDMLRIADKHPQGLLLPGELGFPPERFVYAEMLACAGLLERKGDKMSAIHYIITDRGREVSERQFDS